MPLARNQFKIVDSGKNSSLAIKIILGFAAYFVLYCALFIIAVAYPKPIENILVQSVFSFVFAIPAYVGALFVVVFVAFMVWQPALIMEITPDEIKIFKRTKTVTTILKQNVEWVEIIQKQLGNSTGYMVRLEAPGQRFYYFIDKVNSVLPMQQAFTQMGYNLKQEN